MGVAAAHSQGQALHEPHAIAQAFNANVPMRIKQGKAEVGDEAVRADQPDDLRIALSAGLSTIRPAVLRKNAVLLLEWYEHVVIEHVLERQADDKALAYLLRRDPEVKVKDPATKGKHYGSSRLAKSSWIWRDPFGESALQPPAESSKERAQQLLLQDVQDACYHYARVHARSRDFGKRTGAGIGISGQRRKTRSDPTRSRNMELHPGYHP